jgi:PAS domain S-box-containing protein
MKRPRSVVTSRRATALVAVFFTVIVLVSLLYRVGTIRRHALELARTEARTLYDLTLAFRRWSSLHGGIYVPVTEEVRPNPYLAAYARRDLTADDGTRLTLVNHAMMTREATTLLANRAARPILSKVTSPEYLNPANAPDEWEARALRLLGAGKDEASEVATIGGEPYLRLMRPLVVEKGCLACHAAQRFTLGDVRGALSIAVPLQSYFGHLAVERRSAVLSHLLIWAIGMGGIGLLGLLLRRAERDYADAQEFTETAINAMPGTFFVQDARGRLVRWNKAFEGLWGAAAPLGRESAAVVHPDDRVPFADTMAAALREGYADLEVRLAPLAGGEAHLSSLTARSMAVEGQTYLVVSGIDVTQRKRMESELRAAAVAWAATFDAIHDAIMILDPDHRVLLCNAATATLLGRPTEQILGERCWDLMHDGRIPEECPVARALAAKRAESGVLELKGRSCEVAADPVLDAAGRVVKVVHTIRDVTEQKRLETQLLQAQKMEAVGTLAGGVAHDFNNILSAIVGYASLLEVKTPPDDPRQQFIRNILGSTDRAASLTRSLLSFSRKQATELKPVSLNEIVTGFQRILARLIGEDIAVTVRCCPGDLVVEADQGQIEQVLMNLATNARDAMPKGGRLEVSTERSSYSRDSGEIARGEYAVLAVGDSGVGMDQETQEHIFEPFFTTKSVGKGTGLGLAIVYGIVKKHSGAIHVYSEAGIGTTFKIFLPLSTAAAVAGRPATAPVSLPAGSGTILLVEDDAHTREVARVLLEECGYTVLAAADGTDAVRTFGEHRDEIDLVLTDLIMPNMSGREAVEEMSRMRPGLRAIFMSGYSTDIIEQKGLLEHGRHFISKPLNPMELLGLIRAVLES